MMALKQVAYYLAGIETKVKKSLGLRQKFFNPILVSVLAGPRAHIGASMQGWSLVPVCLLH